MLQLASPVQLLDELVRFPPVRPYLDEKLQEHPSAQHFFDLQPGGRSDFLQHSAAPADQNSFLSLPLAADRSRDAREFRSFLKLINYHGRRVRHFFASLEQNLFADNLRHHEAGRLVGYLILGKVPRPLRQVLDYFVQQHIQTFTCSRRERDDLLKLAKPAVFIDHGQQLFLAAAQQIDLIQQQESWRP